MSMWSYYYPHYIEIIIIISQATPPHHHTSIQGTSVTHPVWTQSSIKDLLIGAIPVSSSSCRSAMIPSRASFCPQLFFFSSKISIDIWEEVWDFSCCHKMHWSVEMTLYPLAWLRNCPVGMCLWLWSKLLESVRNFDGQSSMSQLTGKYWLKKILLDCHLFNYFYTSLTWSFSPTNIVTTALYQRKKSELNLLLR